MILKVCDSLPVLAMKMKDIQTSKGREDAPLSLTVLKEKLIICKVSYSLIIASSNKLDMDQSYMMRSLIYPHSLSQYSIKTCPYKMNVY